MANLGTEYLARCDIHSPDRRRDLRLWGAVNAGSRLEAVKSTGDALIDALYGVRKGRLSSSISLSWGFSSLTVWGILPVRRSTTPSRPFTR